MKKVALATLLLSSFFVAAPALADSDDLKWVAQCLKDNSDAKVSLEIVTKYCTCMNNKMDANETQSITQWEKAHATERKACEAQAGWN